MIPSGVRYVLYGSRSDTIRLWALGDFHIGTKACAMERLKTDIKGIADDPYAIWLGMGDYAEYIGFQDKRFDPDAISTEISVADMGKLGRALTEKVRDLLVPIKDKCLGLLEGNHELRYQVTMQQHDLHAWLCTELEVPAMDYSCIFDVVFVRDSTAKTPRLTMRLTRKAGLTRWRLRIFAHHGTGAAATPGGKLNHLHRFMQMARRADLVLVAHVHEEQIMNNPGIDGNDACTEIVEIPQIGASTGSYLRTYAKNVTTYGEQRGYRPVPLGAVCVEIEPDKRLLRVSAISRPSK